MDSFNPIVSKKAYQSGLFARIPYIVKNRAVILASSVNKRMRVIDANNYITIKEIRREKYDEEIEIDIQRKRLSLASKATCKDMNYEFEIQIEAEAVVVQPVDFYQSQISDLALTIKDRVSYFAYKMAGEYEIDQYRDFADAIGKEYLEKIQRDIAGVEWTIVHIKVNPDERAKPRFGRISESKYEERAKIAEISAKAAIKEKEIKSAKELEALSRDSDAAVYSEIFSGDMTVAEAYIKQMELAGMRSDAKAEEIKKYIEIVAYMKDKGLITDMKANEMTAVLLGSLPNKLLLESEPGKPAEKAAESKAYPSMDDLQDEETS